MPELNINGKAVVLREEYPAEKYWSLFQEWTQQTEMKSGKELFKFLGRFVESWEFPGDPADPKAWGEFDMFTELEPIRSAINVFVNKRYGAVKNSESESD